MNNKVLTKEKKKAGGNWGKPRKEEQKKGSRRMRRQVRETMKQAVVPQGTRMWVRSHPLAGVEITQDKTPGSAPYIMFLIPEEVMK